MTAPRRPNALPSWTLEVEGTTLLADDLLEVRFVGDDLAAFEYQPGQDLMFDFPAEDQGTVRRRYSIRRHDPSATLDIWFAMHGSGPATIWARSAAPGDVLVGAGPRGNVVVDPDVEWHLFVGDESALGAIAAMVDHIGTATATRSVICVAEPVLEQALTTPASAPTSRIWLRLPQHERPTGVLASAVADIELPSGPGHAYVLGEIDEVVACRDVLRGRGVDPARIDAKGYWSARGQNLAHGEPARPDALE